MKRALKTSVAVILSSAFGATVYVNSRKTVQLEAKGECEYKGEINPLTLTEAIEKAKELCQRIKDESGSPGLVVSVTVDGTPIFNQGFGYADVENRVYCDSNTVMRIASISKSMTMAVVAKLIQEGNISLDKPVQDYVPQFPEKFVNGEKTEITLRHLVSHLSGIRHYEKAPDSNSNTKTTEKTGEKDEFKNKEYLINTYYESISKSLTLFQDDQLFSKPGTKFLYTTHGWTLVSAIVEFAVKKPFSQHMKSFFHEMGLRNTYLDENKPIIYNRARFYIRNDKGRLENAPQVDNSYKWAGGGFLSTSDDLVKFGNAMLYCFQQSNGYLNRNTAAMIWTPVSNTSMSWDKDGKYGMGWGIVPSQSNYPFCNSRQFYVSHTGGAVGASSVLLIFPRQSNDSTKPVRGVVVAMIANLQSVGLNQTALEIAQIFNRVDL